MYKTSRQYICGLSSSSIESGLRCIYGVIENILVLEDSRIRISWSATGKWIGLRYERRVSKRTSLRRDHEPSGPRNHKCRKRNIASKRKARCFYTRKDSSKFWSFCFCLLLQAQGNPSKEWDCWLDFHPFFPMWVCTISIKTCTRMVCFCCFSFQREKKALNAKKNNYPLLEEWTILGFESNFRGFKV